MYTLKLPLNKLFDTGSVICPWAVILALGLRPRAKVAVLGQITRLISNHLLINTYYTWPIKPVVRSFLFWFHGWFYFILPLILNQYLPISNMEIHNWTTMIMNWKWLLFSILINALVSKVKSRRSGYCGIK